MRDRAHGAGTPSASCPKTMMFGPCGGVTPAGGCEVDDRPCPFVDRPVVGASGDTDHRPRPVGLGRVLADLRVPTDDAALAEVAAIYRDVGAVALVGEHVDDPGDLTPHRQAERLASAGLPGVVTVTARRRSAAEHRAEIGRVARSGVVAVHCVTGDHPAARFGPGATSSFALDGTRLASVARGAGAPVSVGESPCSPPISVRPERVVSKQAAGADLVVLNHGGDPAAMVDFVDRCRDAGATLAFVAPVPLVGDAASALALARLPGLVLPDGLVDAIEGARDPRRAGVSLATDLGHELLGSGRFDALNLSGTGAAAGPVERAELVAEVATALAA